MELFRTWNTDAALAHLVALAVAYVLALPIGWNREREERSAGLRTFPLVAMAACGFVMIATEVLGADSQQHSRILEGLMTGMGFVGGGAILKQGDRAKGTATAASLWATGAIGAAVGSTVAVGSTAAGAPPQAASRARAANRVDSRRTMRRTPFRG